MQQYRSSTRGALQSKRARPAALTLSCLDRQMPLLHLPHPLPTISCIDLVLPLPMLQPSPHVAGAHWKTLLLAAQSALFSIAFIHLFPPTDFDLLCGSVHRERTSCAFALLFNPFDISTDPPASARRETELATVKDNAPFLRGQGGAHAEAHVIHGHGQC